MKRPSKFQCRVKVGVAEGDVVVEVRGGPTELKAEVDGSICA